MILISTVFCIETYTALSRFSPPQMVTLLLMAFSRMVAYTLHTVASWSDWLSAGDKEEEEEEVVVLSDAVEKSSSVMLTFCPGATWMSHGASAEPHFVSSAIRLEMRPVGSAVFTACRDWHWWRGAVITETTHTLMEGTGHLGCL